MTKTTDLDCEDTAMDDISSPPPSQQCINNESLPKEITLKFTFKVKKTEKVDSATMHRNILTTIEDLDDHVSFLDQHNNTFSPQKTKNFSSKFTYETFPRKHFHLICVAHKLKLSISLKNLKRDMRNVLVTNHANITAHTWSTLDTRDVGWLLQMHPRLHNRQDLHLQLSKLLSKANPTKETPEFQLYVKTISDNNTNAAQRSSAQAIVIESKSDNIHNLRELLHSVYNTQSHLLPGTFIPINYQHIETKEKYSSLIRLQRQYLEDHRNISLSGVPDDKLNSIVHYNNKFDTILNHIHSSTHITWISPSISSDHDWNLSTNSSSYYASQQLVKMILDNVKESSSTMSFTPHLHQHSTSLTTTTKTYLDALNAFIPPTTANNHSVNSTNKPTNSTTTNTSSPTNTISTETQSSPLSSLTTAKDSIALENMKEHLTKSISILRKEMKSIQDSFRSEIKERLSEINNSLLTTQQTTNEHKNDQDKTLSSSRVQDSISSLKNEFNQFRSAIRQELKDQLLLTVTEVVQTTTTQISSIITKEVHRALQTHLHALSPRNRKPKRSHAPNIDETIQQQLFPDDSQDNSQIADVSTLSNEIDKQYEAANSLFEANMTIQPTSPPTYFSDMEEDHQNQP